MSGLTCLRLGEILIVLVDLLLSFVNICLRAVLVDTLLCLGLHICQVIVHRLPER